MDVEGTGLMVGLAKQFNDRRGALMAGVFFEAGTGRYDTYNHFDGLSVQGSGRARYVGGGVLLRQHWDTGIYAEGSLRAGQASADWGSSQMRGADDASYDTSSPYYGAHYAPPGRSSEADRPHPVG